MSEDEKQKLQLNIYSIPRTFVLSESIYVTTLEGDMVVIPMGTEFKVTETVLVKEEV